jgi:hypothetical protein
VGLFGLESSQSSIRFGCTHYRRKRRWLTRPGQFEAQADPNLSAAARTHGGCTLNSAAHVKPEHAAGAARPWLSVEKPMVRTDRPGGPDAVRYMSVDTATQRSTALQGDGTEKKRPA